MIKYSKLFFISYLVFTVTLFVNCESVLDEAESLSNLELNVDESVEYSLTYFDGKSYSDQLVVLEVERLYYELSKANENFGGLWHDKEDQKTIWIGIKGELTSENQIQPEIREIVNNTIGSRFDDLSEINFKFIETEFSFLELSYFRNLLNPPLHERQDIIESFIDHENNSYSIGILKGTNRNDIVNFIENYSVPKEAIHIYETDPVQLANYKKQSNPTLRDYYRPVMGGLQIMKSDESICTFSFNVKLDNVEKWVTNSHCTDQFSQTSYSNHYQNNPYNSGNLIGTEFRDFQGYTNPDGSKYRYSDASLISKTSGVSSQFGAIANTQTAHGGWGVSGNLEIASFYSYLSIVGESDPLSHSTLLYKTGRTTGKTKGLINGLCVDVSNIIGLPPGWTLKCQVRTDMYVRPGDSGSPVYSENIYTPTVYLYGIIWGSNQGLEVSYFSPISAIRQELTLSNEVLLTH